MTKWANCRNLPNLSVATSRHLNAQSARLHPGERIRQIRRQERSADRLLPAAEDHVHRAQSPSNSKAATTQTGRETDQRRAFWSWRALEGILTRYSILQRPISHQQQRRQMYRWARSRVFHIHQSQNEISGLLERPRIFSRNSAQFATIGNWAMLLTPSRKPSVLECVTVTTPLP